GKHIFNGTAGNPAPLPRSMTLQLPLKSNPRLHISESRKCSLYNSSSSGQLTKLIFSFQYLINWLYLLNFSNSEPPIWIPIPSAPLTSIFSTDSILITLFTDTEFFKNRV